MRSVFATVVVMVLAVGCSRRTKEAAPEASVAAAATSVADAGHAAPLASSVLAVDASVAPAVDPPALALPRPPPGTEPKTVTIAASICAAAFRGREVGCRSHPPFERPEQLPDGKIVKHTGDPLSFCAIDRVYYGAFTRPGAEQAVVAFGQCKESEGAEWDAAFPGSAVLVENVSGRWKAMGYEPEVNAQLCLQSHRSDARDVLLCRSNLAATAVGSLTSFFLLDFARGPRGKRNAGTFARVFSDEINCIAAESGLPSGLVSADITSVALADLDKNGTPDLVVKVRRARAAPSAALDAKVNALCKQGPEKAKGALPPATVTTLELLSDGDGFTPSAATKTALDAWTAEAPSDFNGLSTAGPPPL
jgi:hypothetical protein